MHLSNLFLLPVTTIAIKDGYPGDRHVLIEIEYITNCTLLIGEKVGFFLIYGFPEICKQNKSSNWWWKTS